MGVLSNIFSSPQKVGKQGEKIVEKEIKIMNFFSREGKIIKNVYVPNKSGRTTEIDIIFITRSGVFVLEVKNYIGYIFGDEHREQWVKTVYKGKNWIGMNKTEKQYFYNPIWQNKNHIRYLKNYLDENIQFFSGIVFSGDCEIKDINIYSVETFVCHKDDLIKVVKKVIKAYPKVLSNKDIDDLYSKLKSLDGTKRVQKDHVKAIKNIEKGRCPLCGGKLVDRTAKRGNNTGNQFYGCSNYPECKYTRNI